MQPALGWRFEIEGWAFPRQAGDVLSKVDPTLIQVRRARYPRHPTTHGGAAGSDSTLLPVMKVK